MNGADIKNYIFSKCVFGFKPVDVINCLREISEYVVSLEEKFSKAHNENEGFKAQIAKYKNDQDSFKEIISSAQEYKRKVVSETKAKADKILSDAKSEADRITTESKTKVEDGLNSLKLIENEVKRFKNELMALYKAHIEMISKVPEQVKNSDVISGRFSSNIGKNVAERDIEFDKKSEDEFEVNREILAGGVVFPEKKQQPSGFSEGRFREIEFVRR